MELLVIRPVGCAMVGANQLPVLKTVEVPGGNKYRLIVEVFFRNQVVLVRHVLTHKEYDKGEWKA